MKHRSLKVCNKKEENAIVSLELTVLTVTYNRAFLLKQCFESLCAQTCKDFEWLIVDDGSTDETQRVVEEFQVCNNGFPIYYYKKENGGKHTGLNYSHPYIHGTWTIMLDDDDTLTPDAVECILPYCSKYDAEDKIGCLSFQKGSKENKAFVDWGENGDIVSNAIDFRINARRFGDCAEVIKSNVLRKYPFPQFENERFLLEDHLWIRSAYEYDTVYIRKIIYIAEYQEAGLTKSGKSMRIKNPLGGVYSCGLYFNRRFKFPIRLRKAILFNVYAIATKKWFENFKCIKNKWLCLVTFPFGLFFFLRWRCEK